MREIQAGRGKKVRMDSCEKGNVDEPVFHLLMIFENGADPEDMRICLMRLLKAS
jgi:hypothetical protein